MKIADVLCALFKVFNYLSPPSKYIRLYIVMLLCILFMPFLGFAFEGDIEKDLQYGLERSRTIVVSIQNKLSSGASISSEITRLKSAAENIRATDMLLEERFKIREEKVKTLGTKAVERHQVMADGYRKVLKEYLSLIENLPAASSQESGAGIQEKVEKLRSLFDKIVPKKKRPIFGSLPYKNLNYPAKEPSTAPTITAAYRGGNQNSSSDELSSTPEAPISIEIAALAQSLNWSPVLIYEYVKNNVETEWYWGCMKGAEETLHQKSGNDCDQATLLVALLRASGYPSRYVRGTIEFFPDIQTAKNLTGIDDPQKNAEFFQKAGIPFKTVLDGTTIRNIQIERMWVETFVPYANYRGAIMDDQGKTWLGLDTSIKASGYTYNTASDIMSEYTLSTVRDDYLNAIRTETPLEYLRTRISDYLVQSHPTKTYNDYLSTRTLVPEVMQILPSGLQFKETAITNEYTAVPAELIHTVTLSAKAPDSTALFTISFDAYKLSNRKVIIHFEPETVEDQEIIDSFGGLSFTPAYLVHLRPTLMIDDQRIVIGNNGIAMGGDFELVVTASSPNSAETFTNSMISGNTIALGIVSQKATLPAGEDEQDAADLLSREAIRYIDNWNKAEDELASLLRVSTARPIPSIITLGNTIDVTYVLDQPHGFAWKGLFLDADLRAVESVQSSAFGVQSERQKLFMQLSGLQGSALEGRLFEDAFNVASISTAKLFGSANSSQPVVPIISIDQTNIATVLPTLPFDQNIKDDITNAVNQNSAIRIPQSEMIYQDWTGIGYIKENSATGEAGYMLSGMVAGGMTALGVLKWPEPWDSILQGYEPLYTGPTNTNPSASYSMEKVSGTDYQAGQVVNTETTQPLAVVVKDISGKPVKNASVTFTIKAGGGSLKNAQTGQLVSSLTTTTDSSGRAKAKLKLGKLTSTNPSYVQRAWETYPWQVGENIVDGTLGSGPNSGTSLTEPFTIVAFPDAAAKMNVTNSGGYGDVLNFYGTLSTFVTDTYGNPISNATVTYNAQLPQRTPPCVDDGSAKRAQLIIDQACTDNLASWGECANAVYTVTAETYVDGSLNVGVVLGDWPSATYPISISSTIAGVQTTTTANLYTRTFGTCDPENPPQDVLNLEYFHQIDAQGHNIEARPANVPSPIWAKAYVLSQVDGLPTVAYPPEMTVMFTATNTLTSVATAYTGTHQGNGKYQAAVTLAAAPYDIKVDAAYSTASPKTKTGRVYGVDIQTPAYLVMPIDQNGTAIQDVPLTYTIGPSTYLAATAQILVYKNDVLVAVMQTEKQGAGFGTIARGFNFDKNSYYYYRVVLNYGYNSEIWSGGVPLVVSSVEVLDNSSPVRELKFGDGHNAKKKYHVELISNALVQSCPNLNGISTIRIVNSNGNAITAPEGGYATTQYNLQFTSQANGCNVSVQDGATNKGEFVISNLTTTALVSRNTLSTATTAVLYGGLGNKLELNIGGTKKYIPIEPVGVIVLGIDGLRQDVLYLSSEASYTDSNGCGQNTSCNVPVNGTTLPGLSQILQDTGMVKLKDVTAIFPSITFTSWASIFTGLTPSQTGITGNEFFARDLYDPNTSYNEDIPGLEAFPSGMVTLDADGGSFLPGITFAFLHAIPAEFIKSIFTPATLSEKLEASAPTAALNSEPLWSGINTLVNTKYQKSPNANERCDKSKYECRTVSIFNQYAEGADWWGTASLSWKNALTGLKSLVTWDSASLLDNIAKNETINFITKYFSYTAPNGKSKRFPAVFSVYLPGLDHYAHGNGMGGYVNFLKGTTDPAVKEIIDALKNQDEFDNKVFVVVADHGHTQMPTDLKYVPSTSETGAAVSAEMSCKLDTKHFYLSEYREAELANNNLHIWEIGEVLKAAAEESGLFYKVLAPAPIASLFKDKNQNELPYGATSEIAKANVIAALNGPMAHIYLRSGDNWKNIPSADEVSNLAIVFKRMLQEAGINLDDDVKNKFVRLLSSIDKILIRQSGIYKVFNGFDALGNLIPPDDISTLPDSVYVKPVDRIIGMNNIDRSGDIVLIFKDFTNDVSQNRYTSGVACKSWHGSLSPSDSYVPLIVTYPGGNKTELESFVNNTPGCSTSQGCDGNWRVTDLIQSIINKQYSTN